MGNPWFRLYHEFATDPKVQMMSEADQRRLIMLFCIRCSNGSETFHDEEVAFQLRVSMEEWQQTKALFIAKNFIDKDNKILKWDNRQYVSDSSTERVRKFREKMKQECNVSVTPPDTEQIQNRTEKDIEKKPRKKHFKPPSENEVVSYFTSNGFSADSAKRAFSYYEEGTPPWTDSKGNKVRSWKQKMRGVWFKPENKATHQQRETFGTPGKML